ncbi:polyprenyl synthetase family protein [Defluviitalea phaphyphila]|uniref:polyprenyl synthetase family protein n=1 Tax=Defluviitalea phaphyphila TaxID=1473580 RepID=UPI0007304E22|nr:polyprenyl synthetase family protein [Defluviitalea phaphyphila]
MDLWKAYPEINIDLDKMEKYMKKVVRSRKKILTEISLELIESGGKRLRPAFVILGARYGKKFEEEKIIPLASAIELLHTATLVHDDIIDDSKLRRGKITVQAKWGKDMAVYTGDYLFTKAFTILSDKTSFKHMNRIARAVRAICEGEIDQYEIKYNVNVSVIDYLKRIYRKTAILFAMSILTGAYEAKASKKTLNALGKFGVYFGMAFQIRDDLLEYTSTEKKEGKPMGTDIKQGIYTLPLLFALEDNKVNKELKKLLSKKENVDDEDIEKIIMLVKQTKALDNTEILKNKFINKALKELKKLNNKNYDNILKYLIKLL